jgi:hypothetical protein
MKEWPCLANQGPTRHMQTRHITGAAMLAIWGTQDCSAADQGRHCMQQPLASQSKHSSGTLYRNRVPASHLLLPPVLHSCVSRPSGPCRAHTAQHIMQGMSACPQVDACQAACAETEHHASIILARTLYPLTAKIMSHHPCRSTPPPTHTHTHTHHTHRTPSQVPHTGVTPVALLQPVSHLPHLHLEVMV